MQIKFISTSLNTINLKNKVEKSFIIHNVIMTENTFQPVLAVKFV